MKKKILFVGNSYTYFHDMPERIFAPMAKDAGLDVEVQAVTHGGYKLCWYADPENPEGKRLRSVVEGRHYDYIVLQDHSLSTIVNPGDFFGGLRALKELLQPHTDSFVLYATWGRKPGSKTLEDNGWTNSGMTQGLREAYSRAAEQLDAEVSNVGLCFYRVLSGHPEIELYNPDLSHPSYAGSCLAALCHYHTLFGEFPTNTGSLQLTNGEVEVFRASICK